jgi:cytochrome c oxidase cbb3-type subunit 3
MDLRLTVAALAVAACNRPPAPAAAPGGPPAVRSEAIVSVGGSAPPAATLTNPLGDDRQSVKQGEEIFAAMNCDGCHGIGATGWVGPSLVDGRWRYGGSDGLVFHSIYYGRPRGMPAYGGTLSDQAIWKIVTYLRAQPAPRDVPTESWVRSAP